MADGGNDVWKSRKHIIPKEEFPIFPIIIIQLSSNEREKSENKKIKSVVNSTTLIAFSKKGCALCPVHCEV